MDISVYGSERKGLVQKPAPVVGEKYNRLKALPITIQDPELRENILDFECVEEINEAIIARLLELAVDARWRDP